MVQTQAGLNDELGDAAREGNAALCQSLIAMGADVNWAAPDSMPTLHWACFFNHPAVVKVLLDAGADPNARVGGSDAREADKRAISWALRRKNSSQVVTLLLDAGGDPNAETGKFDSPLLDAVTLGSFELCELLVERGARSSQLPSWPRVDTRTAFQEAVFRGLDREVALFAHACKEDIDQVTLSGKSMFELATTDETRALLYSIRTEKALDGVMPAGAGDVAVAAPATSRASSFSL